MIELWFAVSILMSDLNDMITICTVYYTDVPVFKAET